MTTRTKVIDPIDKNEVRALREWLASRRRSKWHPGFDEQFRRGYDTAVWEVAQMLGEAYEVDQVDEG